MSHLVSQHLQHLNHHQLLHAEPHHHHHHLPTPNVVSADPRHHHNHHHQISYHHPGPGALTGVGGSSGGAGGALDCLTTQKAVAFLAGPRERIHVLGNPVEHCPRCQQEGHGSTGWRPHRHIGELKIRYICER